jgi:hypothetical protein
MLGCCAATTLCFVCIHLRSFCQLLVDQHNLYRPAQSACNVAIAADAPDHVKSDSSILCYTQECNHGGRGQP